MPSDSDLLFGKLAVSKGFCAQESLEWFLAIQATTADRIPLGRILVNEGYLSEDQHSRILALQRKNMSAVDPQSKKQREAILFGKLAVREGLLTAAQANECLAQQAREKRSLGEIMVAKGFLTAEQVRDLLARQEKKIMYCAICILTFTVLTISQGKKTVSCPRCKGPLAEGRLADSTGTDAEFSTKVFRATKRELPPGIVEASRIIPPEAVKIKTTCVVCDQQVEGLLDSTGRLRCTVCNSSFVPR